jgi:broad specificity phosphatase PhoE
MPRVYLIQHAEKEPLPGDPGLTALGLEQAARTGSWLRRGDVRSLFSSPQRRAQQTAEVIASVLGLPVRQDPRLRERLNWEGATSFDAFLFDWQRSVRDRDIVLAGGDSSRRAGDRMREFLLDLLAHPGAVAAITHGGATTDLLRTLLGDNGLPAGLLSQGVPACAVTTLDGLDVVQIASVTHLGHAGP